MAIAALNLVLDFDIIEQAHEQGAPKIHRVVWSYGFGSDFNLALYRDFASSNEIAQ